MSWQTVPHPVCAIWAKRGRYLGKR